MIPDEKQAQLEKAIRKAKGTLVDFRHILLNNSPDEVEAPAFHYDWSNELLFGTEHVAIQAYRESGKGQIVLRSYPLYCLTFPDERNSYIVIIKATTELAENKLIEVANEFFSNPILCARHRQTIKRTGRALEVVVADASGRDVNVRIEVYGKGASIRGLSNVDRRPTTIIGDDIQDTADSRSDTVMERDWDWFLSDVMFLGQGARVFLIGNNLGDRCVIERIHKNREELGFRCIKIPEITDEGQSAWPARRTIDAIVAERHSYRKMGKLDIWLREKMCESSSEETRLINEHDIRYYSPSLKETIIQRAISIDATLDPASSKERSSCFRAIVVNALMPDGHWYILDIPYGRWDSIGTIDKIFETVTKWGVRRFGIEKGQLQQTYEPMIYREMSNRNIRFGLYPLEHGKIGNKLDRIRNLQPLFKSGSVWIPDHSEWQAELKTELFGVTNFEIKAEFIDLVDALAMQTQWSNFSHFRSQANERRTKLMQREAVR